MSLRERSRQRARQDLLDAGAELFREHGYAETTISAIAEAAGMSRRSYFRYFRSKEDLVLSMEDQPLEYFFAAFAARPASEPPIRGLCESALQAFEMLDSDDRVAKGVVESQALIAANPALRAAYLLRADELSEEFARVVAARLGVDCDSDCRPRLWVALVSAAVHVALGILTRSHEQGSAVPAQSLFREVLAASTLFKASDPGP